MIKNNLLYSYDEENKIISPIPASPFLLPAVAIYLTVWAGSLLTKILNGHYGPEVVSKTRNVDYIEWKKYRDRYLYLVDRRSRLGLNLKEIRELMRLQYPPWAQPGEVWTYK